MAQSFHLLSGIAPRLHDGSNSVQTLMVSRWCVLMTFTTVPLAPPWGWHFWFTVKRLNKLLDRLTWTWAHMVVFPRGWIQMTLLMLLSIASDQKLSLFNALFDEQTPANLITFPSASALCWVLISKCWQANMLTRSIAGDHTWLCTSNMERNQSWKKQGKQGDQECG